MKKKIMIAGNGFASLFFIMYFLGSPVFPFLAYFFRRIYARYDITLIGNGAFIYFPAIPEFLTKKGIRKASRSIFAPSCGGEILLLSRAGLSVYRTAEEP